MDQPVLSERVVLHDITNAESFVRNCIHRAGLRNVDHELREELVCEGLLKLVELARDYDPAKESANQDPDHVCRSARCCVPSFAGYATYLLPRKILDRWHALHPEHQLRTQQDGKRRWVYLQSPKSIDELIEDSRTHTGSTKPGDNDRFPLDPEHVRTIGDFVRANGYTD